MSYIKILNSTQKKNFELPPKLSSKQREELLNFSQSVKDYVDSLEKDENKILFIMMYLYFRLSYKFFNFDKFIDKDINYVCQHYQLNYNPNCIPSLARIHYFKKYIRNHFGFSVHDNKIKTILEDFALTQSKHLKKTYTNI